MSRHSKNNTANPVFTYAERQMVKDFGIQKQRIGADSQKPFEHCSLCLSKVIEPMICDKGHIFCRECIIENMIKQKKNNNALIEEYKKKLNQEEFRKKTLQQEKQIEQQNQFERLDYDNDVLQRKKVKDQADLKISGYVHAEQKELHKIKEILQDKGKMMITNSKEDLTDRNFWIPEGNHFDNEDEKDAPLNKVICPSSNDHELKVKKLIRIHLFDGGNSTSEEVYCYACSKTIKYQKIAASKKCGHVMCKSCLEKICLPEKKCMVCSKSFEPKDIVSIEEAKSGFVSHNSVEAKKFTPRMLI